MFEIGTSLREARLRQGLDFPELEQATKIRGKYLRALEDEEFEILPAQTYVKGFLRAYADYLGLDGQLYVDEYNSRYVVGEDDAPFRPRRSSSPARAPRVQSRVVFLTLLGIAVVTALVVAAWIGGNPKQQQVVGLTQETSTPAVSSAPRQKPLPVRLAVRASNGASWIRVWQNSRPVFAGWVDLGTTRVFRGRTIRLDARTPAALTLRLNGKPALFPAGTRDVIATARGVRSAGS
jgi:cytoskeleton protein RodZ